jgi:3-hydroxyacyl-CoA dehydrogenase
MKRLKPGLDVVLDILESVAKANPANTFAQSILRQYQERGGLSKKQLQGLYGKAQRLESVSQAKLATLEAIILKKHEKTKSELPVNGPMYEKDKTTGELIQSILAKYPQHKRVLFLRSKYDNNEPLTATEYSELQKFSRMLK